MRLSGTFRQSDGQRSDFRRSTPTIISVRILAACCRPCSRRAFASAVASASCFDVSVSACVAALRRVSCRSCQPGQLLLEFQTGSLGRFFGHLGIRESARSFSALRLSIASRSGRYNNQCRTKASTRKLITSKMKVQTLKVTIAPTICW